MFLLFSNPSSSWNRGMIISFFTCILFWCTLASSGPVFAAEKSYVLGERDVISMVVYAGGEAQLSADLSVAADGRVTVPMLGPLQAKGRTLDQLKEAINAPLAADYFVNPQVILKVKEFRSLSFYISGAVENPGMYAMEKEPTIVELIGKAGGLKSGYGHSAYILNDKKETKTGEVEQEKIVEVDLLSLLDSGGRKGNIKLKNGDMVQIPFKTEVDQAKSNIFIEGEVKNPGIYPYRPGLTALTACLMAGGFNEFSAPNRARIIRTKGQDKEIIKIDLEDVKDGSEPDIVLQPGDFIHIPETWL